MAIRMQGGDPADPDERTLSDRGRVETAFFLKALLNDDLDRLKGDIADERDEADVPNPGEQTVFSREIDAPHNAETAQREADEEKEGRLLGKILKRTHSDGLRLRRSLIAAFFVGLVRLGFRLIG